MQIGYKEREVMKNLEIPKEVLDLYKLFTSNNYELYVVGGCVRDSIMGKEIHDWDMCTDATPLEMIELFKKNNILYYTKGIEFGTIVAVLNWVDYEITTYREDSTYSDGRRPDEVSYVRDIRTDLSRRDFTINAIAMNPSTKELVDPFNGEDAIKERRLECVGKAIDRFNEDGLRLLRAIRFAVKYELEIEEKTKEAMHKSLSKLDRVAKERLTEEFRKLFKANKPIRDIFMEFSDIISYIIPEIKPCIGFNQNNKYHKHDVYEHMLWVTDLADTDKFEIKMASLLHDIGKPKSYVEDEEGQGHFYGHPLESKKICEVLLERRFRLTNEEEDLILKLVENHDEYIANTKKSVKKFLVKNGENFLKDWYILKKADFDDHIFPNGKENLVGWLTDISFIKKLEEEILAEEACLKVTDLKINGRDIMTLLNIKPSKEVGLILNKLLDMVVEEEIENNRVELEEKVKEIWGEMNGSNC